MPSHLNDASPGTCFVFACAVCSCRPYTLPNGDSNGQPDVSYEDGIDWGNGFVGQYDLADVQYKNFTAINNNIGMYWKGSRNFRTVGTAHIKVKASSNNLDILQTI
jgi:hypothetical protein